MRWSEAPLLLQIFMLALYFAIMAGVAIGLRYLFHTLMPPWLSVSIGALMLVYVVVYYSWPLLKLLVNAARGGRNH